MPNGSALSLPVVLLSGTPFDQGYAHGQRFREEIRAAIVGMEPALGKDHLDAARRRADTAWSLVRDLAPLVASEIEGIAEGSGAAIPDIMLRSGFEFLDTPAVSGCSAVAGAGPKGAIVAQNWDAPASAAQELAFFVHFGREGFERMIVAPYGGLCWVGCNNHGLALVNNDLMLASAAPGLPSQIVRRLVLEERSVPGAIERLKALPHMAGRSYLLGDASGKVAGVEVSASVGVRVNQVRSPVLHTNHALDADIVADEDEALLMATHPSSRHRYDVLRRKWPAEPTFATVASLLADRDGYPDAVCKALSPQEPTATVFSAIIDCGDQTLFLCPGAPGDYPYHRFAW